MKRLAVRFLSLDHQVVLSLAALILLVAFAGIHVSQGMAANMLRSDAESTCAGWVRTLESSIEGISAVGKGVTPDEKTKRLLEGAVQVGDIYGYKIFDRKGRLVLGAERGSSPFQTTASTGAHGEQIAWVVANAKSLTEAHRGDPPESPAYFAKAFIPIKDEGIVVGVFEVYLDQTADKVLYERSLLLTEGIIALAVLFAGGIPAFMVYRKMVAHRAAQAEAIFLAEHDSLTGVANRSRLRTAAKSALAMSRRNKAQVAVLLIDLDRFKHINDSYGHSAGDEVLQAFAKRLTSAIREEDMVARLGGDEFVILQAGVVQPNGASHLAERLMKSLPEAYQIGETQLLCAASIGIAIGPGDAEEWDALLSCADRALYKAKNKGRNHVCFFEAGMDAANRERLKVEADLRRALSTKAFHLDYQPVFSFSDHTLLGFEALLRWPEGWEALSPSTFIPVAEESGLMVPIGAWVLEDACTTAASWEKPLQVSVNLSPIQFGHGDIVAVVKEALRKSELAAWRLELEVTESLWLQNTEVVLGQLAQLRQMGVSIALDDFGTGFSSLTYLLNFPFSRVKIDRSFVAGMEMDSKAAAIVDSIMALGKSLHLTITAEGVETTEQAQALIMAGCNQVQGYLFGGPLSAKSANELIREPEPAAAAWESLLPFHLLPAERWHGSLNDHTV